MGAGHHTPGWHRLMSPHGEALVPSPNYASLAGAGGGAGVGADRWKHMDRDAAPSTHESWEDALPQTRAAVCLMDALRGRAAKPAALAAGEATP